MMNGNKMNRSVRLNVRVTPDELTRIKRFSSTTTCRKLSDYHRRVLLHQPVTINQRNQSLDEFMIEMIRLREELNRVENDWSEAEKKLNTLKKTTELNSWFLLYEMTRKMLLEKVEIIKQKINSINDQWLQ
ncbi:MAG: plasmid mobilization relaxosome protein MobC, partial [Bacteroidota bacterium]|nr:plasmid mobilization relaxosome protein MobC [Bacteroidota bacterium]